MFERWDLGNTVGLIKLHINNLANQKEGFVRQILITGSEGLVGTHLTQALPTKCYKVKSLDVKFSPFHTNSGNILEMNGLRQAAQGCMGIIHLAAVSRVIWGERDPKQCWQTNVIGQCH